MGSTIDLRPSRLLVGAGALLLAAAVGAGVASAGQVAAPAASETGVAVPAAPGAALVADDTAALADLGLDETASLTAATGLGPGGQAAAAPARGAGILRLIAARTERAEITVTTADGQKTFLYVRGTVSAVSSTGVTVKLRDGSSQAFAIDSTTKFRGGGQARQLGDVKTGSRVQVFGLRGSDGAYTAKLVRVGVLGGAGTTTTPNP